MNIQLLSLFADTINKGMINLSLLSFHVHNFNYLLDHKLNVFSVDVFNTYVNFFTATGILPDHSCNAQFLMVNIMANGKLSCNKPTINKFIDFLPVFINRHKITATAKQYSVVPLNFQCAIGFSKLYIIAGVCLINHFDSTAKCYVNELWVPARLINFNKAGFAYLDEMLKKYEADKTLTIKELCSLYNRGYKQFQRDSKIYFGTTFYNFTGKLKMLKVMDDLMFSNLSLKEIVIKNDFAEYSNMHKLFNKFKFPIKNVTRLVFKA